MATSATQTVLRNYQHASRIFVDGQYRLSPKYGFLFYVEFDFNPLISSVSNTSAQELGMIVKNVSLPKFTVDTKTHNAYNRVNIVQNKIKYDPVSITFHDDQADNVRNFWYDYYSYFYRDSDYADASYNIIHKYQERPSFEWGYTPKPIGSYNAANAYQNYQYIQAIRIYSLYQNNFSEYELINPIITNFRHGDHDVSNGQGLLEHQMSVQFETVKYQNGNTTTNTAGGYIDLHYDTTPSPNGGTPAYETANQTVTDLASFNLTTNGGSVVPPITGVMNSLATATSTMASATNASAGATTNAGGFVLPALGSLTSGISNSALISGQLAQSSQQLAGSAAGTLASGAVQGATGNLGSQGTQILGIAGAAISNPSAALATAENMAMKYATGAVTATVNALAQRGGQYLSDAVGSATSYLNKSLSYGDTGLLTTDLQSTGQNIQQSSQNLLNGYGYVNNTQLLQQNSQSYADDLSQTNAYFNNLNAEASDLNLPVPVNSVVANPVFSSSLNNVEVNSLPSLNVDDIGSTGTY